MKKLKKERKQSRKENNKMEKEETQEKLNTQDLKYVYKVDVLSLLLTSSFL